MITHGSLFSGIGGFDLASEWMGWENKFHCEWEKFPSNVLKYYWPQAQHYEDITKSDFTLWRGRIDVLTGGFPCQPFSTAGKRKGTGDSRYLWPEMLRVIREVRPRWIVGENVYGLINWDGGLVFDTVCLDLENEGFKVIPVVLPACGVNAPHQRYRVWFVAHSDHNGQFATEIRRRMGKGNDGDQTREDEAIQFKGRSIQASGAAINPNGSGLQAKGPEQQAARTKQYRELDQRPAFDPNHQRGGDGLGQIQGNDGEVAADTESQRRSPLNEDRTKIFSTPEEPVLHGGSSNQFSSPEAWSNFPTVSPLCSRNDGVPYGLDGITFSKWRQESIKGAGNAIVPQVAYQIFRAIQDYETMKS